MSFADTYLDAYSTTPLRIGGEKMTDGEVIEIVSPYDGGVVGKVVAANEKHIDAAIAIAKKTLLELSFPAHQRALVLDKCAAAIAKHHEDLARIISTEAAKPIKTARAEVDRAVQTFLFSAAAARTLTGETIAMESHPAGENKIAFTLREPIGVVAAIAPFNFPLNLVAHKVAPAIAAGCPLVLKPAHNTPLSAAALVDILIDECDLPPAMLGFIPCPGSVAQRLSTNDDVAMISFTGSPGVGWSIRATAAHKKVALELGNNAPVIVEADADLDVTTSSIANSGYSFQGQSCISVQRVYVHASIYESFLESLASKVEALVVGDPLDDATDVSALISKDDTTRVSDWIGDAISGGARLITGGTLDDNGVLRPTVLADTNDDMDVCRKEVFGPLVSVMSYTHIDEALARANDTSYGLQAAIFTRDMKTALHAARTLDFGGVLVNETPTYRADNMPYGGVRDSGNTKEGPAYTVHEMTVEKLVILNEV